MARFRKVPKYRKRMTRFQVPNTDTAGTKKSTESQLCSLGKTLVIHKTLVLHETLAIYITVASGSLLT